MLRAALIPYGHHHHFVPFSIDDSDAGLTIRSRCANEHLEVDGVVSSVNIGCGMEEERMFDASRHIQRVRYRIGGMWFDPLDLYRATPLPVIPCSLCHGEPQLIRCARCFGSGVIDAETEGPVAAPNLTQVD